MPEPRTYLIGLPVCVTVHDDGTVTYTVDTSEADEAPRECRDNPLLDEHGKPVEIDDATIDADTELITASIRKYGAERQITN